MRRYSPDQILFLGALVGVVIFTGVWFTLILKVWDVRGTWLEIPAASVPLILLPQRSSCSASAFRE
jgi:hypothetical protein